MSPIDNVIYKILTKLPEIEMLTATTPSRMNKKLVLEGLYPATITPFTADMEVDYCLLEDHLRDTCEAPGVSGIAVNGGLGELLQLTLEEQVKIVELALQVRRPGQLIIAGLEGRSAREVIASGRVLKAAGAEAFLVLPPFDVRAYRRLAAAPSEVYKFFQRVDESLDVPMIVFQYPPASGLPYTVEALLRISTLENVVGIKAASGNLETYQELWDALHERVSVMVALDSPPLLPMLEHGAHGALIGISAIVPEKWSELLALVKKGETAKAHTLFDKVCRPLMASVFENQQPKRLTNEAAAVKEALVQLGRLSSSRVREPAVDVNDEVRHDIFQSLVAAGLLACQGSGTHQK